MKKIEHGNFCQVLGVNPRNAMIEFFIEGKELDYGIGDVAKELNLNRATAYNTLKELLKDKSIISSRKIGKTQLYKLNLKNKKNKLLIDIFHVILKSDNFQVN